MSQLNNQTEPNQPNVEFDRELDKVLINNFLLEPMKEAIKQAVDKYVLGDDPDRYFIKDEYADEALQEAYEHGASDAIHDAGIKQRKALWGSSKGGSDESINLR